jgi:hypothetical protein
MPPCIAFTRRCSAPSHSGGGDDRVSGTDADRHDDIYHNGNSGFGGNADRCEMADLGRALIMRRSQQLARGHVTTGTGTSAYGCPKNDARRVIGRWNSVRAMLMAAVVVCLRGDFDMKSKLSAVLVAAGELQRRTSEF